MVSFIFKIAYINIKGKLETTPPLTLLPPTPLPFPELLVRCRLTP